MSTVRQAFSARDALYPASNYAQFKSVSGTNFPLDSLAFDASTEEAAFFAFPLIAYGSGSVTVRVKWYADTATSGGITFGASVCAMTPNSSTQDIEARAFDTEVTASDTHLGTTGQRLHEFTIDVVTASLDGAAAGDWCVLKLARKVADAGDTMTGDALVVSVEVEYSDT